MARAYYCKLCLEEVSVTIKAIKGKGMIVNIIEPHLCFELTAEELEKKLETITINAPGIPPPYKHQEPLRTPLDDAFDAFSPPGGDKRDKEHLRKETSIAPRGILEQVEQAKREG